MQDLAAGRIDLVLESAVQLPFTRAGNIKSYAVTSDARLVQAPDTPTFSEMGLPSFSSSGWTAMFAPKGVPQEIIGKLNAAAVEALADQGCARGWPISALRSIRASARPRKR